MYRKEGIEENPHARQGRKEYVRPIYDYEENRESYYEPRPSNYLDELRSSYESIEAVPSHLNSRGFSPKNVYRPSSEYSKPFYNEVSRSPCNMKMSRDQYEQPIYPKKVYQNDSMIQKEVLRKEKHMDYKPRNMYEKSSYYYQTNGY